MLKEGDLIAGKYRIERMLGEGGMGYVMAAMHEQLHQRVAIKFLDAQHAKDVGAAGRFLREARAAVRIQSEHVARVLDVAELPDGSPYMVMEFLLGNDLAEELKHSGTFSPQTAVDFVLQACEAVAEAHSLGLVHRDLKPANLFLTSRADGSPLVKVLDFGISKALTAEGSGQLATLTSAQSILGSPAYMSPEQARKPKSVDMRTDIWSLGVILYEFLSGSLPFSGDTLLSILAAAVIEVPVSVREIRDDLPPGIEHVVARCLEKSPDDRYQTVAELAEALAPFAAAGSLISIARIGGTVRRASLPPAATSRRPLSEPAPPSYEGAPRSGQGPHSSRTLEASDTYPVWDPPPGPSKADTITGAKAKTLTDWGSSQSPSSKPRRLLLLAGAAGLGVATLLWFSFGRTADGSANAAAPSSVAPEPRPSAAAPSSTLATAGSAVAVPIPSASVPADKPASATRSAAAVSPAPRKQAATRTPATPPATTRDVLDGRL